MLEDEDSKVRRNLLVVSAAVLLVLWLNVPVASIFTKLLGFDTTNISPRKVWTLVLLLLLYLCHRYWFSTERIQGWTAWLGKYSAERTKRIEALLRARLLVFVKHGRWDPMFSPVGEERILRLLNAVGPRLQSGQWHPHQFVVTLQPVNDNGEAAVFPADPWQADAYADVVFDSPEDKPSKRLGRDARVSMRVGAQLPYMVNRRLKLWSVMRIVGLTTLNSEMASKLAVPTVFAAVACTLSLAQLVRG